MFGLLTCCKPTTYKINTPRLYSVSTLFFYRDIDFLLFTLKLLFMFYWFSFIHVKKCAIKGITYA